MATRVKPASIQTPLLAVVAHAVPVKSMLLAIRQVAISLMRTIPPVVIPLTVLLKPCVILSATTLPIFP